jgi:hypothetical protein
MHLDIKRWCRLFVYQQVKERDSPRQRGAKVSAQAISRLSQGANLLEFYDLDLNMPSKGPEYTSEAISSFHSNFSAIFFGEWNAKVEKSF